jgi:hypothetical protein
MNRRTAFLYLVRERTRLVWVAFMPLLVLPLLLANEGQHQQEHPSGELGVVQFPVSCAKEGQKSFERGIALLHSFWYEEAQKVFETIAHDDPGCAMAYWGIAMSQWHQVSDWPDANGMNVAQQALSKADALKAGSDREQGYIAALGLFYRDLQKQNPLLRAVAYSDAMEALHLKYPSDNEAAAFYALSLLASEPDNDTTFANRKRAAQVLEGLFAEEPNHPGIAHYLIHTYDKPQLAQLGLPAAQRYAKIAPASPHALHMPSHIFARLGLWQADIDSNLASIAATQKVLAMHMEGGAHQFHAMDYLMYAYLQSGRDGNATAIIARVEQMRDDDGDKWGGVDWHAYSKASFPAVYALEVRNWTSASRLELVPEAPAIATSVTYWARAIGAARSGNSSQARMNAEHIKSIHDEMIAAKQTYFEDAVLDRYRVASAWADYADGFRDKAFGTLRAVAEKEESTGNEPSGIPAREMLADLLLDAKRPDHALVEYELDLKYNPNRFNGLYGAGRAAEIAGQPQKAHDFYALLVSICAGAASQRPELAYAKDALAKR